MVRRIAFRSILFASLCAGCTNADLFALRGDPYALDGVDRSPDVAGAARCHPEALVAYRGTWLKLEPTARVAGPFAPRLERFEEALLRIGGEVYGRPPSKVLNVGTYVCRSVEQRGGRLSEHALGNAIDVTGFYFPALPRETSRAASAPQTRVSLPPRLRGAFTLDVFRDYLPPEQTTAESERHQRFFARLREAIRDERLFRGVIAPPEPAHRTHLHLDMGPWSYHRW